MRKILAVLTVTVMASAAQALAAGDDVVTATTDAPFADAMQAVNDAIVNRGYKIDYHGHIGDMLDRTAKDIGATRKIYKNAEFVTFCSAVVSRSVMEAEPADIAYCPYVVFAYEDEANPGTVVIGHRKLPEGGARDQVNTLLNEIVEAAADGF